jgi:opine dehydrogenase
MAIFSVIGAGNGGQALAACLKNSGHEVRLWNRSQKTLDLIRKQGKIIVEGLINIQASPDMVSNDLTEIIRGSEIIFIVLPADAHFCIASMLAPIVKPNQVIILNPGRTAGALEFKETLKKFNCMDLPIIMETQSLLYTCRIKQTGYIEMIAIKNNNCIASLNKKIDDSLKVKLMEIYKGLEIVPSTLQTGLENIGAILHPGPVLLNIGWIESRQAFFPHYYSGISKTIAGFLEKIDFERIRVAEAYNIKVRSIKEWHEDVYGCSGQTLYETLQNNSKYASIDAPYNLNHRYIFEDIPTGLVPISELAKIVKIPTPNIDLIISLATSILGIDFRMMGRNLDKLGLKDKSFNEVINNF